jgi:transcriptional regulator with XRE-family HTH domain
MLSAQIAAESEECGRSGIYSGGMSDEEQPDPHEQEIRRITQLLSQLIHIEGRSQRSLEQELGLGSSGVSKILKGVIRLQVSHVLTILGALGIPPGQFFGLVFPSQGREHPSLEKLRELEGVAVEEDSPEFDNRVRRALLRLLAKELHRKM